MAKLTDKQEKFIQEYLLDLNATQAAIRAGYSAKTATEQASRLLANVKVSERVAEYQREQKEKFTVSFQEKQELLLKIATYGIDFKIAGGQDQDAEDLKLQQINPSASVAAIKELNLMSGDHAATKVEATVNSADTLPERAASRREQ